MPTFKWHNSALCEMYMHVKSVFSVSAFHPYILIIVILDPLSDNINICVISESGSDD